MGGLSTWFQRPKYAPFQSGLGALTLGFALCAPGLQRNELSSALSVRRNRSNSEEPGHLSSFNH